MKTLELRGFYLKQAQLMSVLDDFVPPAYLTICKRCQDEVPTLFQPNQAREIVEASLGKKLEEVFSFWDEHPRGIASIGQVHRAILHDGREVAVKIQFPGIEKKFRSDLKTIKLFCALALPQHVQPLEEIEKQFLTEFDYRLEAENLNRVYNNVMSSWSHKVAVPQPITELCTRDVLVMEYIHGKRLVDGIRDSYRDYAAANNTTIEELEEKQKEEMKNGTFKYRSIEEEKWRVRLFAFYLKVQDWIKNSLKFVYNNTMGLVSTPYAYKWTVPPVNLAELITTLFEVHGHEIFVDGEFNGDPHPGNIILMPDGRLGLIDYGQVKRIPEEVRINYAKTIVAYCNGNQEKLLDVLWNEIGSVGKYRRKDVALRLYAFWNDRNTSDILQGMNIAEFLDWCQAEDPVERINPDYVMISRVNVLLRGMGNAFGLQLNSADFWKEQAMELLRSKNISFDE